MKREPLNRIIVVAAALLIAIVLIASFLFFNHNFSPTTTGNTDDQPVYLGVTYGGSNVDGAKLLIDEVKNYTNLFIVQSSELEKNITALNSVCNYAVNSGLYIIVYFSAVPTYRQYISDFYAGADVWGKNLLGIYFDDEPGGKMLDAQQVNLYDNQTGGIIQKMPGQLTITYPNDTRVVYSGDDQIGIIDASTTIFYQPDGTVYLDLNTTNQFAASYVIQLNGTVYERDAHKNIKTAVTDPGMLPKIPTYQQILAEKPLFRSYDDTERIFVSTILNSTSWPHSQTSAKLFTSDYALQWFDYKGGYDVVFAEFGWNQSVAQEIAQTRGASNLQAKDWGAIVTWKYDYPERIHFPDREYGPFLGSGDEIYDQLKQAYEAGAKYLVVFNYPNYPPNNPYGVLLPEHFAAIKQLWTDIINGSVVREVKAQAALVMPENYGWGMRNPQDNIWGIWQADNTSPKVWISLQNALATYGINLDIVYNDPAYPTTGKYETVIPAIG